MTEVYLHASELITGKGIRAKDGRRPLDEDLGRIPNGAVVVSNGKIQWVGASGDLPAEFAKAKKIDLENRHALIPGLIDCHTHLVFSGDRAEEFALRCAGVSYQEIAESGGGILTTVRATREASLEELVELAAKRAEESYRYGVRTIEVKSGYGLDLETELKILRAVVELRKRFPAMTFVSTFLGAHAIPQDRKREEYISEIIDEMLPQVAKENLADFCDVFVDDGYFTPEEARRILSKAKELGLGLKLHADELVNTESAALAAELGAASADHLLRISQKGIQELASSGTVGVLLPGTAFYLKAEHAPARKLIDAGAAVALATDFNPGTCMTLSLPTVMTISALYLGMSRAEIFAGVTYNAARALGLEGRKGCLIEGYDADLCILPFARFEEMYYRFAWVPPAAPPQLKGR